MIWWFWWGWVHVAIESLACFFNFFLWWCHFPIHFPKWCNHHSYHLLSYYFKKLFMSRVTLFNPLDLGYNVDSFWFYVLKSWHWTHEELTTYYFVMSRMSSWRLTYATSKFVFNDSSFCLNFVAFNLQNSLSYLVINFNLRRKLIESMQGWVDQFAT
jgi:hypothetical protein